MMIVVRWIICFVLVCIAASGVWLSGVAHYRPGHWILIASVSFALSFYGGMISMESSKRWP